ncbi:hypothetical protein BC629DRAFT_16284 [Irpex lacteus]|nr:hypothetical protein BC629DRAFT_16284 [Irpex lacteus]
MPLHRHYGGPLRHSTSASAIPPRRLPSPSVMPATQSRPFVTNDIPQFNPTHRSTVAASATRDILEHNDKGILPPHDPSHTTPFSTFSHPSIPDTAPTPHGHIERPTIPPVHASSPSSASLSALPTPATSPRVDLRATTTPAYVSISRIGIMNEDIDGTTEEAEVEAAREPTSIPIDLPSNISISPVGYAPPSPSTSPGAPRTMSRRFFTQLLEETRRRSRCTSQPTHSSSSSSPGFSTTTNLPSSPTLSTIVVSPPPRKSSLRPSVSAYPLGAHSNNASAEDICITETIHQLEQLAERVRLSSRSTSVLLASPTRTGFPKRSASVESLVDVCMRSPTPALTPTPLPTLSRGHHGVEVVRVPHIVVTLPSSEDVPSCDSDTSSESSPTVSSDSDSGSEEGSVPEDVRWIAEYGRWSSATGSSSGSGSSSQEGSSSSSQDGEDDIDNDNDSEESDVSSLFVDGGDDGEGEGDDTDTLCTSPPTSPRGHDKGRRFMKEFEVRSSSDQAQGQGQAQGFTFSLRRPPSQLFRRPRVSVIRPSKSLVFQARTEMGQRVQRPPPFKLPQARSSPHKDLPKLPLPSSLSYSHSSHPSPFTPPDLGSCHHQQHDLLRESPSHGVLPAQSQSCWSISTDGHGGRGKGGKGGWTKGLKRLFGRAR